MRFAYLDSQGNEVPVPSVDALGLRIELGAIGPDTQLYDAQEDRWGPAHTHELFNTLARGLESDSEVGSVPTPSPVEQDGRGDAGRDGPLAPSDAEGEEAEGLAAFPVDQEVAEMLTDVSVDDLPNLDVPSAGRPSDSEPFFDLAAEIASVDDGGEEPDLERMPSSSEDSGDAGVVGDLDLDFTLTDHSGSDSAEEVEMGDPSAVTMGVDETGPSGLEAGDLVLDPGLSDEIEPTPLPSGGELELEAPLGAMDFSGADRAPMEDLQLDPPYAQGPVDEMQGGAPDPDEPLHPEEAPRASRRREMDFSRSRTPGEDETDASALPEPTAERIRGKRRETRSRPSPPRRVRTRASSGLLVGIVVVAAVGAGGYFGWRALRSGGDEAEPGATQTVRPPVAIPEIPAELMPRFREVGEAAMASTLDELRAMQVEAGIPAAPRDDWLAGVYLANASQFEDVEAYWLGVEAYVELIRQVDGRTFHTAFARLMEEGSADAEDVPVLQERADSGFMATRPARLEAYALMDDLAVAALDLHAFLLDNEADIDYEPAGGGVSRDPVLEAVPNNASIGDQMWDMVDRITGALDALGTLDRVTTERLSDVLLDRIRRAGFE